MASIPTMLDLCVMISLASLSVNSKMLVIICASLSCSTPCSCPSLTIDRISSSVTSAVSACGLMPNSLTIRFARRSNSFVTGVQTTSRARIGLIKANAHCFGYLVAIFFGTSTPATNRISKSTKTAKNTAIVPLIPGILVNSRLKTARKKPPITR